MRQETLTAITSMLTGLGIPHGTDPDILLRTYAVAVHGIREDCIVETCGRYIRGEVEGHKKGRAPTTDLFTAECRSAASAKTAREQRPAKQIAAPEPERQMTEAERAAMRDKLATLKRALAGDQAAQNALRKYGWEKPSGGE